MDVPRPRCPVWRLTEYSSSFSLSWGSTGLQRWRFYYIDCFLHLHTLFSFQNKFWVLLTAIKFCRVLLSSWIGSNPAVLNIRSWFCWRSSTGASGWSCSSSSSARPATGRWWPRCCPPASWTRTRSPWGPTAARSAQTPPPPWWHKTQSGSTTSNKVIQDF